jgi:signal transduction histidine kinase
MIIRNEALDRFILTGSMFYAICACITMWLGQNKSPLDDNHILVLQIGAIVELILLNAGLVYKSRMLQNLTLKSQNELIEKYAENQELLLRLGNIREKITRDLHDDVGATLSSVKAYAEILKNNQENPAIAELIKDNAAEMIERLEVIAWATNPVHDNFGSLKNRMIKFITPLCHAKKMSCKVESKDINDGLDMPGEFRQNIFLVFKEAVNNTIKYANATDCSASMLIENRNFILQISDNGHGSDGTVKGSGTGWKNMQKRAEELKGQLKIASVPEKGTTITFSVPYPFKIPNTWDKKSNGMN